MEAARKMKATALEVEAAARKANATALELEATTEKMKATALEMEAASEKMKARPLDMETASEKMRAAALEMDAASEKLKATALEIEAASEKMKSSVLDVEAAPKKMANIFTLTVNVILYIFRFLDMQDRIAFSLSCQRFRRLCMDEGVFRQLARKADEKMETSIENSQAKRREKLDLSRSAVSTKQRKVMKMFFRDRQLTENIRELNISNLCSFNWQMTIHLQKFIKSICPQLEELHILNCGVNLQRLCQILKQTPHLTSLSWSIWDFTSEDIEFLLKTMKSPEGICLKNIKHLHLHMYDSLHQIQIANYLVLSCCEDLEELEIYPWWMPEAFCTGGSFPLAKYESIPGFHQPSVRSLHHLHSLVVVPMEEYACYDETYRDGLYDFVDSVLMWKSSSTAWKKLLILPEIDNSRGDSTLFQVHSDDFHSVETIGADLRSSDDAVDEIKTLFEGIGDNIVRRLQLCLPSNSDSIVEFCNPISRVAGHSLKFLSLSFDLDEMCAEQNILVHTLLSNCLNITELDLLDCKFERDICEPLSKLKHLSKVHLMQCAISSKYNKKTRVETSKANLLTFVENCKKITHLDVHGYCDHDFVCCLTDDDLLAFARLRNLESLTLCHIRGITEWTFMKNVSEHCKFLSMLRIRSNKEHFNDSHVPVLMESCRFLKHLAIHVDVSLLASEVFWNLLSHAKNLERLCISNWKKESVNIPVAVETLNSLPRLHVLHLHSEINNVDDFYDEMISVLEEKESDCRFSFEIVTENRKINHSTGYSFISSKTLPLNKAELCSVKPIMEIPEL